MTNHFLIWLLLFISPSLIFAESAELQKNSPKTNTTPISVIKFATSIYPPFTTSYNKNELRGFDIDIANALCNQAKIKCTFDEEDFSNMIEYIKNGKYDAWINGISITSSRQRELIFSLPYFSTKAIFIANNDSVFTAAPAELKNKVVGVQNHSCYVSYLKKAYKHKVKTQLYKSVSDALKALEQKKVDAVIGDEIVITYWRSSKNDPKDFRLIHLPAKHPQLAWLKYRIAVKKNNYGLLNILNKAIEEIKSKGEHDLLIKKHFLVNNKT